MKSVFKRLNDNLKNSGSSLVLVIVALGFVGVLTGSLLMAVAYAYRQKLYDYNAKSNFYYLEQAMDEVYAGVGSKTMEYMQKAYEDTKEEIFYYDDTVHEYVHKDDKVANDMFKNKFMKYVSDSNSTDNALSFKTVGDVAPGGKLDVTRGIGKTIVDSISNLSDTNGTVTFIPDDVYVIYYYNDSDTPVSVPRFDDTSILNKVVIKNVTLSRTASYNRSNAKGDFTQTISTDLVISRPDFDVDFGDDPRNVNNLFEFCLISDSGVEVNKDAGSMLSINGNIYAANDFYDKKYNDYDGKNSNDYKSEIVWDKYEGTSRSYKMTPVTKNTYIDNDNNTLFNANDVVNNHVLMKDALYDGNNIKSKYSGFYVDKCNVNVFANKMIVPGSIAVMNSGNLSVYGLEGTQVTQSQVWADEIVLDGSTRGVPVKDGSNKVTGLNETSKIRGADADFTANLYVKDDTQVESDYSRFRLNGSYYGYGNSTAADTRKFIPTTLISTSKNGGNIYEEYGNLGDGKGDGNKIRAHYNSSSFIVNGQHANVNLTDTQSIFIAGRSYIELSKVKTKKNSFEYKAVTAEPGSVLADQGQLYSKITTSALSYDSDIQDYKTGESLSIKTNQLAYKPNSAPIKEKYVKDSYGHYTVPAADSYTGTDYIEEYYSYLPDDLKNMVLFSKYFNTAMVKNNNGGKVPVVYAEEKYTTDSGKEATKYYYYLDFQFAYDNELYDTTKFSKTDGVAGTIYIQSADDLSKMFITDYYNYLAYVQEYDDLNEVAFVARHSGIDTDVLQDYKIVNIGGKDVDRTNTLFNLMDYEDYFAGAIGTKADNIYASGAVTTSYKKTTSGDLGNQADLAAIKSALNSEKDVTFFVQTKTDAEVSSTNLGADPDTTSNLVVNSKAKAMELSKEYEEHYNYMKWSLQDLPTADSPHSGSQSESQFVRKLVAEKGADSLTPLNNYFNFDKIVPGTDINPSNLKLSYNNHGYSEFKVYVSYGDVHVKCESAEENGVMTGIIITKGDVYFDQDPGDDKNVKEFNGIIVTGGKVYLNGDITKINSSELCKTIMSQVIQKAKEFYVDNTKRSDSEKAIYVLEVMKEYEEEGKKIRNILDGVDPIPDLTEQETRTISTLDYSDVLKYNNWMRNVD